MAQFMIQDIRDPTINIVKCSNDCICRSLIINWGMDQTQTNFVFPNLESLKAFVGLLNIVVGNDHD